MEAVMSGERQQRSIVDDVPLGILVRDGGLHAVVQDFDRHAADRVERRHVTAQQRLQILVQDEARLDVPGVPEHHREQPHDPRDVRLVFESHDKAGEVDLRLMAGRCLEPDLERFWTVVRRIAATRRFTTV